MRRPGFALLQINKGQVSLIDKNNLDQKKAKCGHGRLLRNIIGFLRQFFNKNEVVQRGLPIICVRQQENCGRGMVNHNTSMIVAKAIGATDMFLDSFGLEWFTMNTQTIKKTVGGSASKNEDTKQLIANALQKYIGKQTYETDDESDAVGVGIAFLISANVMAANKNGEEEPN